MTSVVSLGSINVDRVRAVDIDRLADLEERYDWFPGEGETVTVEELPVEFDEEPDQVLHGGKGANQAIAARSASADTALLGMVGPDHEAFGVLDALREAGVDANAVAVADAPTGKAEVFVDPAGENRIVVRNGANAELNAAYVDTAYERVRDADVLLLQNEISVGPVAHLLDRLGGETDPPTVILDPAPVAAIEPLLSRDVIDYVTPNDQEYRVLGDALDEFDGILIHKRGGDSITVEGSAEVNEVVPPAVDPVDTTGAGDVLNGFLAARLAAGDSFPVALSLAVDAASLSTASSGARGGIPALEAVQSFRERSNVE